MGRAARNHGGTGGHGCVPLPGERPDFNRHVMSDTVLLSLVPNHKKKKQVEAKQQQHQLGLHEGFPENMPITVFVENQSYKQQLPRSEPTLQSLDPKEVGFQLSVTSVSKPETSLKQPLTSMKQSVTKLKQSVTLPKQQETSVKHPVASVPQPVSSPKLPVHADQPQQQQQTLASDYLPLNLVQVAVISAQLPDTKAQNPVTSVKQPVTSIKQAVSSVCHQVATTKSKVQERQQTMTSGHLSFNSIKPSVISGQLPVTLLNDSLSSVKQLVTQVPQPVTAVSNPGTSDKQPKSSVMQSVTSVKQPLTLFPNQVTSSESSDQELQQQTLPSDQPRFNSFQLPGKTVEHQVTSVKQKLSTVKQPVISVKQPVSSVWPQKTKNRVTSSRTAADIDL